MQHLLDQLLSFRSEAGLDRFREIFGKVGAHLWTEFNRADCDVIKFYGLLDSRNRARFAQALASGGDPEKCVVCERAAAGYVGDFPMCEPCMAAASSEDPICWSCNEPMPADRLGAGEWLCESCDLAD